MLRVAWSILQLVLNEMTPTSFATTRDVSVWVALVCVCARFLSFIVVCATLRQVASTAAAATSAVPRVANSMGLP